MSNYSKSDYEEFARDFANSLVSQDFPRTHQFFAPWLQKEFSPVDFKNIVETNLQEMNEVWEIDEIIYPTDFSVSSNSCSLSDLKKLEGWRGPKNFSDELTDDNFRRWMVIQFLPDEDDERIEFDAWFDFWFVLAEVNNELRIGYFEFEDPD